MRKLFFMFCMIIALKVWWTDNYQHPHTGILINCIGLGGNELIAVREDTDGTIKFISSRNIYNSKYFELTKEYFQ